MYQSFRERLICNAHPIKFQVTSKRLVSATKFATVDSARLGEIKRHTTTWWTLSRTIHRFQSVASTADRVLLVFHSPVSSLACKGCPCRPSRTRAVTAAGASSPSPWAISPPDSTRSWPGAAHRKAVGCETATKHGKQGGVVSGEINGQCYQWWSKIKHMRST